MKLVKEINQEIKCLVEENLGRGKEYFIEGVYLQSNIKNKNGRMYLKPTMQREVNRYTEEYINKNRAYGELGHPDTPSINLDRVAIMIKSLKEDGDNYIGKAKVMDTPYGKIVKCLIDEGANFGVSSRGLGSLKQNNEGVNIVQDDFMLTTAADIVADPSAPDAFVRGIMENKEWVFVDGRFVERQIEEAKTAIRKASPKKLEEEKLIAFRKFLNNLR